MLPRLAEPCRNYRSEVLNRCQARAGIARVAPSRSAVSRTEVLLAEPEELGEDVLESCLYILRDRLRRAEDA